MEERYKKTKIKSTVSWIIAIVLALTATIVAILPFVFMIINSFKNKFEMLTKGVFALPQKIDLANYKEVLSGGFAGYFLNSVFLLAVVLALILFISACAAYPLSRFKLVCMGCKGESGARFAAGDIFSLPRQPSKVLSKSKPAGLPLSR